MIEIIHQYWLFLMIGQFPSGPLGGLAITLILASVGLVAAFPLAVIGAMAMTGPLKLAGRIVTILINAIRCLPLLMSIFWVYFALPLLIGRPVGPFSTMLCALIIYEASYMTQIIASGIRAIDKGQFEAATSTGLSYFQVMRLVILPQAIRNMLPSILNQFVSLTKNTSLGYIIGVEEVTAAAGQINAQILNKPLQVYLVLAGIYFILCFSLSRAIKALDSKLSNKGARQGRPIAPPVMENIA